MGLGDDRTFAGNASVFDSSHRTYPEKDNYKGIRLSVAKEEGADGEVSQFGALATALASTIGTGNIIVSEQRSLWAVRELYSGAGSRAFSELQRSMPNRLLR